MINIECQVLCVAVQDGSPPTCARPQGSLFDALDAYESHEDDDDGAQAHGSSSDVDGNDDAVVLVSGMTSDGRTVLLRVHGFRPYAFVDGRRVGERAKRACGSTDVRVTPHAAYAAHCYEREPRGDGRRVRTFAHTSFGSVRAYRRACAALARQGSAVHEYKGVSLEVKFLHMLGLRPCGWVCARGTPVDDDRASHAAVELRCAQSGLRSLERTMAVPWTIAAVDIEACALDDAGTAVRAFRGDPCFPSAALNDPVIQIGVSIARHGADKPQRRVVLCLRDTAAVSGMEVLSFRTERELLNAYGRLMQEVQPQIITGFNVEGFDWAYMAERARATGASDFWMQGLLRRVRMREVVRRSSSAAMGDVQRHIYEAFGCVTLDLLPVARANVALQSYKLDSVCGAYLPDDARKVEMPYGEMMRLFVEGGPDGRAQVARYCSMDCDLCLRLESAMRALHAQMATAYISRTPLLAVVTGGQSQRVLNQLFAFAHEQDPPFVLTRPARALDAARTYQGATVIEPLAGHYTRPVCTLDFASLYPSLMITFCLCPSNLVASETDASDSDVVVDGVGRFARTPGILPAALDALLKARKAVRAQGKRSTDPAEQQACELRQKAIKVAANSIYGVMGFAQGPFYSLAVAQATTKLGRLMIERSKTFAETSDVPGDAPGDEPRSRAGEALVVYGDTDSIMVRVPDHVGAEGTCPRQALQEVFAYGEAMAASITRWLAEHYVPAGLDNRLVLEFEDAMVESIFWARKRYAARVHTVPDPDRWSVKYKGIEVVRRSSCVFARTLLKAAVDCALSPDGHAAQSMSVLHDGAQRLLDGAVPIADLTTTRQLRATYADTAAPPPHKHVADLIAERDPGKAPPCGSRVGVLIVCNARGRDAPLWQRAEDPAYAESHGVPADLHYVLEKQVAAPARAFFDAYLHPGGVDGALGGILRTLAARADKAVAKARGQRTLDAFVARCPPALAIAKGTAARSVPDATPRRAKRARTLLDAGFVRRVPSAAKKAQQ